MENFLKAVLPLSISCACVAVSQVNASEPVYVAGSTEVSGDVLTQPGEAVDLIGYASHPEQEIARYEWDFDSDGVVDYSSTTTGITQYTFTTEGGYTATFRAFTEDGTLLPESTVRIAVSQDVPEQTIETSPHTQKSAQPEAAPMAMSTSTASTGDGKEKHYVLILNGGSEERFWKDMEYLYSTLKAEGYSDSDIYLLNYDGLSYYDDNPNNMIDYAATRENLETVVAELAGKVDGDDILHVFVDDHGNGYTGPVQYTSSQQKAYGYNGGVISVDPGDEVDYLESDFKLRALVVYGDYYDRHTMGEWGVYKRDSSNRYYRQKFVSTLNNVTISDQTFPVNDNDEGIELLKDYLKGDYNGNGVIESGEVMDYDGDGIPPYDHSTGVYDEDDWGEIDTYTDSYNFTAPAGVPPVDCLYRKTLDVGLDNTIDYLCSSDNVNWVVIATDYDNDGMYDGVDVNLDGDFDDNVSIDETISLKTGTITDDDFALLFDQIDAGYITFVMEQCNSGGFIDDLSRANRVIYTAAEAETVSWGNLFIRNSITAFSGISQPGATSTDPAQADINGDGVVDFAESFRFSTDNDNYPEVPQYDDNGDGISSASIPNGSEGNLGSTITLAQNHFCEEFTAANSDHESNGRAYSQTETTGQTCYGTICFGGTTTTTWYANGSDDVLGTSGTTQTTVHSTEGGFALGTCPVPDTVAPVITLNGDASMTVYQNSTFTDPGATAQDDEDGDLTSSITVSGNVDTSALGLYILTYSVEDAAGNVASVERNVEVVAEPDCVDYTDTLVNHESATRAYSQTETTGQTCYGTFCFGGTTTTTWYAQGSDENLGTDGNTTVTLKTVSNGYAQGSCPAEPQSPVIESFAITELDNNHAVVTGTASDANGDLDRVEVAYDIATAIPCTGTTNFSCYIDFATYDFPEGEAKGVFLIAHDAEGRNTGFINLSITRPALGVNPPVVANVESIVNGSDVTVTADVTDSDGDLSAVNLVRVDAAGTTACSNSGGDQFTCNLTGLAEGTYTFKVEATDLGSNTAASSDFEVVIESSATACFTAANIDHEVAGRAELKYNVLYYAIGSGDYLGQQADVTSLQETSAGVWNIVSNCP